MPLASTSNVRSLFDNGPSVKKSTELKLLHVTLHGWKTRQKPNGAAEFQQDQTTTIYFK